MDRWRWYQAYGHWLWVVFFVAAITFLVAAFFLGCGPGEGAARQAARSAVFVMQALCSDDMTVKECGDVMLENAAVVDRALDGGVH